MLPPSFLSNAQKEKCGHVIDELLALIERKKLNKYEIEFIFSWFSLNINKYNKEQAN